MRHWGLCLLLLVSACAAHHPMAQEPVVNPYREQAEGLARSGVEALGMGRWQSAQRLFEHALRSASLTGDAKLMALAWYNLGRARQAGGDAAGARQAYASAVQQAEQAQDAVNRQRAALALALLESGEGVPVAGCGVAPAVAGDDSLLAVPASFPVDVHLAAAQLAVLRGRPGMARKAYARVLQLAGRGRPGLIYAARAHLGLACLAVGEGPSGRTEASRHIGLALQLLGQAGEPRLTAQALRLAADNEPDPGRRNQLLRRAEAVQQAWRDSHPQ